MRFFKLLLLIKLLHLHHFVKKNIATKENNPGNPSPPTVPTVTAFIGMNISTDERIKLRP